MIRLLLLDISDWSRRQSNAHLSRTRPSETDSGADYPVRVGVGVVRREDNSLSDICHHYCAVPLHSKHRQV